MTLVIIIKVNEQFGTIEDLKLIAEAHRRDLKIMMDIVINHTSTEHEWFKQAYSDKSNHYRDYYFFKRSADNQPPTNWESKFGGNA